MESPNKKTGMSARHLRHLLREKGNLIAPDSLLPTVKAQLRLENKQPSQRFEVQRHLGQVYVARQGCNLPHPQSGEALLQMVAAGICGADIRVVREDQDSSRELGHFITLGHEGVGRVISLNGSSTELQAGDYAVVLPQIKKNEEISEYGASCSDPICIGSGHTLHMGWDIDGCFTDFMSVPTANLVRISQKHLRCVEQQAPALREAVFALVEPMLCVLSAYELIERQVGRLARPDLASGRALVIGCGPVGILHSLALLDKGFEVWLTDSVEERADLALWCLDNQVHIFDRARHQGMFDLVMITVSNSKAIRTSETLVRDGGIVYLFAGLDAIDRVNMLAENSIFYEQLRRNARGVLTTPRLIGGEKSILYIGHSGYFEHLVPKAIETVTTHAVALDRAITGIIPGWSSPYVRSRVPGGVDQVTEDGSPAIIAVLSGAGLRERHCKLLVLAHHWTEQSAPGQADSHTHAEAALPFDMKEKSVDLFDMCNVI